MIIGFQTTSSKNLVFSELSRKYSYLAYIGGGFGAGIHNTLEAAAYGIPVVFGPNYHKFNEAKLLIESGAGFSFANGNELMRIISELEDNVSYRKSAETAFQFVHSNAGSTSLILNYLEQIFAKNIEKNAH